MIRKIGFLILILSIIISCKNEKQKEFASFSGKITYAHGDDITIRGDGYSKTIKMNDDGSFKDTLHLDSKGSHFLFTDGNDEIILYLKNGDDLKLTGSTTNLLKTMDFSGNGSETNNYLVKKSLIGKESFTKDFFNLEETEFDSKLEEVFIKFETLLNKFPNMDADLTVLEKKELVSLKKAVKSQYIRMGARESQFASLEGKKTPEFDHYINYKGGKSSLKDFKGKFIYLDIWATWCSPCRAEIPHLQQLEKDFKDKNIIFISISVDKKSAYDSWRSMIKSKSMSGVQLFANGDTEFMKKLKVNSIPRFIIINPEGLIVKAETTRPSNPKTKELLNNLLK